LSNRLGFLIERTAWALLCIFVFTLPLEKAVEIPGVGTISRMMGLAAFVAGAMVVAWRRRLRTPNAVLVLAAAFVAWSGLTWRWSMAPSATAARFLTLLQLLGMLWLIWELARSVAAPAWLMAAYLGGAAVSSVWTMVRAVYRQQTFYRRYATAGFDPNDLGLTLALAIPMALYLAGRTRGIVAWLCRLAAALAIVAILLTASRTALVVAGLSFLFTLLTWREAGWMQRISSLALFAMVVLGPVHLAPHASRERLATLPSELASGAFHGRTRIWKTGLKLLKRHGLKGVGAAAYPEAVRPWLGRPPIPGHEYTAHNTFLSVLVETGVIGAFLFGSLLVVAALCAWMLAPAERALWWTMLVVWAAGVSTLSWEHRKPTWLILALILSVWAHAFEPRERRI